MSIAIVASFSKWRIRGHEDVLIEGGVTGQLLYEMKHNGFGEGWIRYGVDASDLRDPNYNMLDNLRGAWRNGGQSVEQD